MVKENAATWQPAAFNTGDGVSSTNGAIFRGDYLENLSVLSQLIFHAAYFGANLLDTGASGAAIGVYFLRTIASGSSSTLSRKGLTNGEFVRVTNGTHYWHATVVDDGSGYPTITITDALCDDTATPGVTYNNAGFISSLTICGSPVRDKFFATDLCFTNTAPDGITAANLARSSTDSTNLNTEITGIKTKADLAIDTSGKIETDAVIAKSIDKSVALSSDSPNNITKDGTCERALYGSDIAYGLTKTTPAATSYALSTTVKHGVYSGSFTSAAGGVGFQVDIDTEAAPVNGLAGKNVTLALWVRVTDADNLRIGFYDNVTGVNVTVQTIAANTWTLLNITKTINAAAVTIYGLIVSDSADALTCYVDNIGVFIGDTAFEIVPSVNAQIVHDRLDNSNVNYIFNSQLNIESWLNGTSAPPAGYQATAAVAQNTANEYVGDACADVIFDAAESFYQYVGLAATATLVVPELKGKTITFQAYIKRNAATAAILDLYITTNGTGGTTTVARYAIGDYTAYGLCAVTVTVPADATQISVGFINNGAVQARCYIDAIALYRSEYPQTWSPLTGWVIDDQLFDMVTPAAANAAYGNILTAGRFYPRKYTIVYGLHCYEGTLPGAASTDTFTVAIDGVAGTPAVIMANGGSSIMEAWALNSVAHTQYVTVVCSIAGINRGANAQARVYYATWGA
jgi:hypothetical protein